MTNEARDQVYALAAQYGRMLARQESGDVQPGDDMIDARVLATVIALAAVGRDDINRAMEAITDAARTHERGQFDPLVNRD